MTTKETPSACPAKEQPSECAVPPASADPAASAPKTSRRDFLKAGGMLSMSTLMGRGADDQSDDAHAAAEWAEHFQKNYACDAGRKNEARVRLERHIRGKYGKPVTVAHHPAQHAHGLRPETSRNASVAAGASRPAYRKTTSRAATRRRSNGFASSR